MLYAIISEDVLDSLPLRQSARPQHLARLEALNAAGRLLLAGPHPRSEIAEEGFSGSLIVAEFGTLEEAKAWAKADPYVAAGVYAEVLVKPFRKVLP